ncbi:MAG TPA: efflux RND transporter periplasmic adaptor subunit [Candidatus Moranbacteria bacterium]|nr:efflux RND transporter periplasmic adaptor subunit [Candidatus Moranbacteria bacterium]
MNEQIKKITKNKKIIATLAVILIASGSYYWYSRSKNSTASVQYKTAVAEKGTLTVSVSGSGNVIVDDSANIDPTITGTVTNLSVAVGDKVEKGQLLFSIINDDLGVSATKAHSSYLQSLASLETAKASKKEAKKNVEDSDSDDKSMYKQKLEAAEISVTVAEENIKSSLESYNNAKTDYAKRNVAASISGTVNAINIKNGDDLSRLSSNSNSQAPIVLGDLSTLKAQVEVNEVDIANVKIGQKSDLTFNAISDLKASGKVEKIDSLGTLTSGVVTYNVTISFDSLDPRIKPEMSVSANIITETRSDVILVPSSAVKTRSGKSFVQILAGQTPENKTVEAGLSNDTQTEIVSGISAGEKVITQTINSSTSTSSTSSTSKSNVRIPGLGGGHID